MKRMLGKSKRRRGIEAHKALTGRLFVLPWEIGLLLFVLIPLIRSVWFAFGEISIAEGMKVTFVGLKNFDYIFNKDPNYYKNLIAVVSSFAQTVPIVVVISLIFAVLLNQKFKGRLFFRAVFFVPVIIATGVVFKFLTGNAYGQALLMGADEANPYASGVIDFESILAGFNFPPSVSELMGTYVGTIFNLIWSCGIPIVLFVAALQTIPPALYEASKVEGATPWEEFWFITFPNIGNMMVLVIVFVMLDMFTSLSNPVIMQAYNLMANQQIYDESSAMLMSYFAIIGVIMAAVLLVFDRLCLRRWR